MGAGWQNPRPPAAEADIARDRERTLLQVVERERAAESRIPRRHRLRILFARLGPRPH
jgi:hypothetical protein